MAACSGEFGHSYLYNKYEMPSMSTTPYPPTDYTAVLSAKMGLTTEFGMESGDPHLYGRAHRGHSLCASMHLSNSRTLKVT